MINSHVSQIETYRKHNVTNTWRMQIGLRCLHRKPQASVRHGQSGQLFRPVKSVAAGKTVLDQ